jgi:hypothetical protein
MSEEKKRAPKKGKDKKKKDAKPLKAVRIGVPKELEKSFRKTQLDYIADELAKVVYGKPLSACLGHKEGVKESAKKYRIQIKIPSGDGGEYVEGYIRNITSHARKHGVAVSIS